MKKSLNLMLILLVISFVSACEKNQPEEFNTENHENLSLYGKWFLTEYGYSPGSGYVTTKVNPEPPLYVTFGLDEHMSSNIGEFETFEYFKIVTNEESDRTSLLLFSEKPDETLSLFEQTGRSYSVTQKRDLLKLNYYGCIEGCHLGFKPANL